VQGLGGLKPSTCRLLQRITTDANERRATLSTSAPNLKPGAVLLREWHGTTRAVAYRIQERALGGLKLQPQRHGPYGLKKNLQCNLII
jgi:hypothetical protein